MKQNNIYNIVALLLFLFINTVLIAQGSGMAAVISSGKLQDSSLVSTTKIARLDSFLQRMAENDLFNGSVLVSENGKVVYKKSAGYYNFEKAILNSTKTLFNLASLSKPFTAIAILQLVQKKKISLDEPVSKYLAAHRFDNIIIKNLLTHTSGLPRIEEVEKEYAKNNPNEIISNDKAY